MNKQINYFKESDLTEQKLFLVKDGLNLERGGWLRSPSIAYRIWGTPNTDGSNVVWVCHALTGSADVTEWWAGLFGKSAPFNPDSSCIICANILGSCYGTEGPLSINHETGTPYYGSFPEITIRDMVQAHTLLAEHLRIKRIGLLMGGSLGGQQALEWAVQEPDRFNRVILLATNAVHSPWGVAFNEAQRMAIESDQSFGDTHPKAGVSGLRAARATAMLSYRHYDIYCERLGRDGEPNHPAATYQQYQGEKLANRFNAYSYHLLSRAMDSHDVGRGRGGVVQALAKVKASTLCISIESDLLFPPEEQKRIAKGIVGANWVQLASVFGHDSFLIETEKLSEAIEEFLELTTYQETANTLGL